MGNKGCYLIKHSSQTDWLLSRIKIVETMFITERGTFRTIIHVNIHHNKEDGRDGPNGRVSSSEPYRHVYINHDGVKHVLK